MATKPGFQIPNATEVGADYRLAQPDKGDFLILGDHTCGIVAGCSLTVQGNSVVLGSGPNIVLIDGVFYDIGVGTVLPVRQADTSGRFDLVVFDTLHTEAIRLVEGPVDSTTTRVFPEITDTMVVLGAVYRVNNESPRLVDKRLQLDNGVFVVEASAKLIDSRDEDLAERFSIDPDGAFSWAGDTALEHTGSGELTVNSTLIADSVQATSTLQCRGFDAITSEYITWGLASERPATPETPGDNGYGHVWVALDTGEVSVYTPTGWSSVSAVPTGTVIMSFVSPSKGWFTTPTWLPMDGVARNVATISEALKSLHPEWISGVNFRPPLLGHGGSVNLKFIQGAYSYTNQSSPADITSKLASLDFNDNAPQVYYYVKM